DLVEQLQRHAFGAVAAAAAAAAAAPPTANGTAAAAAAAAAASAVRRGQSRMSMLSSGLRTPGAPLSPAVGNVDGGSHGALPRSRWVWTPRPATRLAGTCFFSLSCEHRIATCLQTASRRSFPAA